MDVLANPNSSGIQTTDAPVGDGWSGLPDGEDPGLVLDSLSNLPFAVGAYMTTSSYATANPGVIAKFIAAEKANLAFLRSNPQQTMAAIQQYNPTSTAAGEASS